MDVPGNETTVATLNDSTSESGVLLCDVYTYLWHDFLPQWDLERKTTTYYGELFICGIRNLESSFNTMFLFYVMLPITTLCCIVLYRYINSCHT
jgi:hypothetical protein